MPDTPGETVQFLFYDANDGGDDINWLGAAGNQGGGAEGSAFRYTFQANDQYQSSWSASAGNRYLISLWAHDTSDPRDGAIVIAWRNDAPGSGGSALVVQANTVREDTITGTLNSSFSQWTLETDAPAGTTSASLGYQNRNGLSLDRVRISLINEDIPGVCEVTYQDGGIIDLDDSSASVLASLTASGTNYNTYIIPVTAIDVASVWIDQIPTDVWDFDPEANSIVFPQELIADSRVMARFITV